MEALRIGIIGLGAFGESHLRAFRGIPGVAVVAVASRSAARAHQIATAYGIPRSYSDYEELCAAPDIDAITVCTEESRHVAPALAALAAGKHVLVEKPLATSSGDALAIREAARASRGLLMPAHIVRFEARFAALKQEITSGALGTIAALHASRNRPRNTLATYGRCHPALVTAIHDLDVILWLLDEVPESVRAWHHLQREPDGVYGIWGTLTFPSGAIATIEATWMMPANTGVAIGDRFAVTGTRGIAHLDLADSGLRLLETGKTLLPDLGYEPVVHGSIAGALQNELQYFVRKAMTPGITPIVTVDDGVRAVITAEAMIDAATREQEIAIDWPTDLRPRLATARPTPA
jgi:UDP-N-acetylglucosamine 3-dehydrogenase